MRESNLSRCLAPPCFTSGGVLERFLAKNPASLSVSDEFGNELQGITRRNATSAEAGKLKTLKELFTIQFSTYVTTQMALTDSEQIEAPSYSIFASSTPGDFYKSLEGSPATGGFLNRFLVLPVRRKIPRMTASELIRRDDARSRTRGRAVEEISSHLRRVNLRRDTANRIYPNQPPPSVKAQGKEFSIDPEIVGWANKATKQLWYEYKLHCSQEISESGEDAQLYFSRAAEIALRIATIISVSRLSNRPYEHALIDSEVMTWSIRFVDWAMRQNFFIAQEYMHTSEYASKRDRILQLIANLSKQAADGWVSHSVVVNRLQKQFPGARVLNDQINVLLEARMLTVEKRESSTGRKPKFYRIADR